MLFRWSSPLRTPVLSCLCALAVITAAASDASKTGYSMQVVKATRIQDQYHSGLSRRGDYQTTADLSSEWLLPVQIGTPPQSFMMTPDSGAPSLAVMSVFLPKNESDGAPAYDPSKSSTAIELNGYTYANCYASNHCGKGVVYNDTVTVGNISVQMAFEVSVSNNGVANGKASNSGNFGLNYAQNGMTTSPRKLPTWLQTVLPLSTNQVFTMDFNETSSMGMINFGFIDHSRFRGSIGYTPVQGTGGEWAIKFSGFQVGSTGIFSNNQSWMAIVDSGTAASALPRFVVDGYFKNISGAVYDAGASTYKFPCSTILPDFVFGIAGDSTYRGTIPLQGTNIGNGICTTKLAVGTGAVIFGQNFIESQFVVFDFGNGRVGFANKGSSNDNTTIATTATTAITATTSATTASGTSQPSSSSSVSAQSSGGTKTSSAYGRRSLLISDFLAATLLLMLYIQQ